MLMVLWPVGISGQLAEECFATDASIAMANNSATKEVVYVKFCKLAWAYRFF
jgi:hypothetical protein